MFNTKLLLCIAEALLTFRLNNFIYNFRLYWNYFPDLISAMIYYQLKESYLMQKNLKLYSTVIQTKQVTIPNKKQSREIRDTKYNKNKKER